MYHTRWCVSCVTDVHCCSGEKWSVCASCKCSGALTRGGRASRCLDHNAKRTFFTEQAPPPPTYKWELSIGQTLRVCFRSGIEGPHSGAPMGSGAVKGAITSRVTRRSAGLARCSPLYLIENSLPSEKMNPPVKVAPASKATSRLLFHRALPPPSAAKLLTGPQ